MTISISTMTAEIFAMQLDSRQVPSTMNAEDDPFESRAIEAIRNGDPNRFSYLVSKYSRRVLSIAWNIVRNSADAEELTQEAFVRAYQKMGSFRQGTPFGPWIFRIVTNLSLDLLKHRGRVRDEELPADLPGRTFTDPSLSVEARQLGEKIDAALDSLPQMQRIVARLSLVEELSHEEIAAMTGLGEGTVRSHLSLARKRLRELLHDLYEEQR